MERTELVEAVDFLINTGTLNQLVEVAVNEAKKQPDDWRSRTCGECGYAAIKGHRYFKCRKVGWQDDTEVHELAIPACPAFVAASIAAGKE